MSLTHVESTTVSHSISAEPSWRMPTPLPNREKPDGSTRSHGRPISIGLSGDITVKDKQYSYTSVC